MHDIAHQCKCVLQCLILHKSVACSTANTAAASAGGLLHACNGTQLINQVHTILCIQQQGLQLRLGRWLRDICNQTARSVSRGLLYVTLLLQFW